MTETIDDKVEEYVERLKREYTENSELVSVENIHKIGEYCRPFGVNTVSCDPRNYQDSLTRLGWIDLYRFSGTTYVILPTEKGYSVFDGLREIRGQMPVREANEKWWEEWNKIEVSSDIPREPRKDSLLKRFFAYFRR